MALNEKQKIVACHDEIRRLHSVGPFAFVIFAQDVYYSTNAPAADKASSAIVDLLQDYPEHHKKRTYYRSADYNPTPMCRGIAEFLNAKIEQIPLVIAPDPTQKQNYIDSMKFTEIAHEALLTKQVEIYDLPQPHNAIVDHISPIGKTLHRVYMMIAFMKLQTRRYIGAVNGHEIAAILVNPDGTIKASAMNTVGIHKTYHAEFNTLQGLYEAGKTVAAGSILYTTLKPCSMCAGIIAHMFAGKNCQVIYAQDDPGTHATNTELDNLYPPIQSRLKDKKDMKIWTGDGRWDGSKEKVSKYLDDDFQQYRSENGRYLSVWLDMKDRKAQRAVSKTYDAILIKLMKYCSQSYFQVFGFPSNVQMWRLMSYLEPLILAQGRILGLIPPVQQPQQIIEVRDDEITIE